mmetsp:Transcript_21980/g.43208  ORF Transcript_21980/g.43208 Transcript_21980/m.43208 type:complete len:225 (-) Transcript_21980:645-1319(-)|eukprot:CAMPEP_0171498664 /NCGR_PEP_ID=MMETSP0958-20121227/7980_1 /TAXON_ID=87120 /ORGANISM="Aurantiochytrium limacinum, Strain ATCCMYA-1381" /LENGTH=224 /DNA_ID=CAMNT_0012033097 /DNA_START=305 /DNA_END=979 /DNA_ORIENTATION=-
MSSSPPVAAPASTSDAAESAAPAAPAVSEAPAAPATPAAPVAPAAPTPAPSASGASGASRSGAASSSTSSVATLTASKQRLMSDLREMHNEPPEGCSAAPANETNLYVWNASIIGPDESPWEGGIYGLRLHFPEQYPSKPPKVRFTCELFHPNVYSDGTLCLDIIQDQWSPIYTTSTILTSIQSLLTDPNPNSPANPEAAKLFVSEPKEYKKRVRRIAAKSLDG